MRGCARGGIGILKSRKATDSLGDGMVKTLVLVRHGKTENESASGGDIDRKLTPAGVRALEIAYPRTFSLLGEDPEVSIWCSPAVRALQTAGVVAEAVDACGIDVHRSIYDQDVDQFLSELTSADVDAETLVVVGHVPFMDELAAHFTGAEIRFNKGAAAAISLPAGPGEKGTLRWYVAGPDAVAWDAMAEVDNQVELMTVEMADALDAFLDEPESVEALRDFRVRLRRLRSLILFLAPWQSKKQSHRTADDLRALLDATSPLREIDILSDSVDALVESGELGENCLLPVACAKERQLELESVLSLMKKRHVKRRMHNLADELPSIKWKSRVLSEGLRAEDFQKHFDEELADLDDVLFGLNLRDGEAVHRARRDAKEMHFVASCLGAVLGEERASASEYMESIQGELGALNDAYRNERLANYYSTSPRFRGVRADLGVVARDQAEVASAILAGSSFSGRMRASE